MSDNDVTMRLVREDSQAAIATMRKAVQSAEESADLTQLELLSAELASFAHAINYLRNRVDGIVRITRQQQARG